MFQFQQNADGSFKAFTFTPCDTALFPSGIRCYKNNEFQQYPLMLKRSYISKLDVSNTYLNNTGQQNFCIKITDGSNDVYTFEFRKMDLCGDEKSKEMARDYLSFLIQTLFDDKALCVEIDNCAGQHFILIKRV